MISARLKQTFASPQLHHLVVGDPSITWEKNFFSLWSPHHYFGAVPLVILEMLGLFCHPDQQHLSQARLCPDGVGASLK